jgi:hypothetical protein
MNISEMEEELKKLIPKMEITENMDGEKILLYYLGSYMSLDPCGKYHHIISPNGATEECEKYWDKLERAASNLGGWINSGEGDPTDIYFEMKKEEDN